MAGRAALHRKKAAIKRGKPWEDNRRPPSKDMARLMHEMKAVQMIFDELMHMEPRPGKIKVRLGRMKADPQVFRQMFREFAASTAFSDIEMEIQSVPVVVKCKGCGYQGNVAVMEHIHFARCPECSKVADILQGNELEIIG